jgi:O-antigen ligase
MSAQVVAPAPAAADEGQANLATSLVALYVFLLFGRVLEMFQFFGLGSLRLMLPISIVALVAVFLTGNVMRALRTPLGVLLIAWTAWMVVCMPFSSWRSESLSQFAVIWLKSLMVFFIIAGLGSTAFAFRRVMNSMAWAAAAACLLVLPGLSSVGGRAGIDRLVGVGTLSNPNEIAFHLWLGMAFLVALLVRSPGFKKVTLSAICFLELAIILKTVSREGLLLALIIVLLTLPRVSFPNKMKIVVVSILVCVFAAATLSHESLDRYMTVFNRNVDGQAAASAEASSRARAQKLHESIELTLRHPIFGVGMGVFMPASVELAKEEHRQGDWAVSHNAYTQVSSELGVPGLLILLAIYFTAFRQVLQVSRAAKQAGREEVRQIAFTLLLALTVLSVHFCFDSIAYVFYMPLITGLIAAFALVYAPAELRAVTSSPVVEGTRAITVAPAVQVAWRQIAPTPAATQLKTGKSQQALSNIMSNPLRNPYRFGRRRKV